MKTDVSLPTESGESPPPKTPPAKAPAKSKRPVPPALSDREKDASPFKTAATLEKRLKLFMWGDSGAGKTTLALRFARPVVIDLERGSEVYGANFQFDVLHASCADDVIEAVDWLRTHSHPYATIIIDPFTEFWSAMQAKWQAIFLRRARGSRGFKHEYFELSPRDWAQIKGDLKAFIRKLLALDMNVVAIARSKREYDDSDFMKVVGQTFDAERSLPFWFDIVLRLFREPKGKFMAECLKDRTNRLPQGQFECSYGLFEELFGKEALTREARPVTPATDAQRKTIRARIKEFGMTEEQVARRLAAYDATTLDDLSEENATLIIAKFDAALAEAKSPKSGKEK